MKNGQKALYLAALLHGIGDFSGESCDEFLPDTDEWQTVRRLIRKLNTLHVKDAQLLAAAIKIIDAGQASGSSIDTASGVMKPLFSILAGVDIGKGARTPRTYVPAKVYDSEHQRYPVEWREPQDEQNDLFMDLRREFAVVLKKLLKEKDKKPNWQDKLLYVFEKYLSVVPFKLDGRETTISMYEYIKIIAAVTMCLAHSNPSIDELEELIRVLDARDLAENQLIQKERFMFLIGDITGIQEFIYDVPMDDAAKNLRGRSFFLGYFTRVLAEYILIAENLPKANIIMAGAGKFMLLLPIGVQANIAKYREYIEKIVYDAFRGKLAVVLAGAPFGIAELFQGGFEAVWQNAGALLNKEKNRKWAGILKNDPQTVLGLFEPVAKPCVICRRLVTTEDRQLCDFCQGFIELGKALTEAKYLIETRVPPTSRNISCLADLFACFGIKLKPSVASDIQGFNYILNSYSLENADGFYFVSQLKADKTFEDLAKASTGIKTWGVLRGDVDNLSKIFHQGMGKQNSLLSFAVLSRCISEFFGIFLNDLLRKYHGNIYTVYAGGDDFFIVGSWSVLPDVAETIRQKFREYCAGNKNLTLSMSIKLARDLKYPLYRVAEEAGELLDERAKSEGKDKIAFMDTAFTWAEFRQAYLVKKQITVIINSGGSHALLTHLYNARKLADDAKKDGEIFKIWHVVYNLSRYRDGVDETIKKRVNELIDKVLENGNQLYVYTWQTARWAELELRNG